MNCPLCDFQDYDIVKMPDCQVYVCKNCSLQYIDNKQNKEYYSRFHERFDLRESKKDSLRNKQYSLHAEYIEKNISNGTILDVGCSSGELLSRLRKNRNFKLFGIDLDEKAIIHAKEKFGTEIQFFDCDLVNFDTEIKFDCIIFRGTFQYLSTDLCKSMKKLNQICSKNSKIIILSLPNSDSFLYKILKLNGLLKIP